jgi:cytochrome c oxidase cbb3-type subunit 3
MSSFWSWFIIIFTVANLVAALWLMYANTKRAPGESDTTGHKWDADLEEYNNPLPRWWLMLFYITVAWGAAYFVLYPGLGAFAGTKGWTQVGQYEAEREAAEARYGEFFAQFRGMELTALAANEDAMRAAHNIFGNNCAQCHGSDGRGAVGFPNLTDDNWQWGGEPDTILASIVNGRIGVMPAQATMLGGAAEVENMIAYVRSLSGLDASADRAEAAKPKFAMICAACHGADGKGNPMLGAPDLTDGVWIYGSSPEAIRETLTNGRQNQMPAQKDILGEDRARLLAAYVLRLSGRAGD